MCPTNSFLLHFKYGFFAQIDLSLKEKYLLLEMYKDQIVINASIQDYMYTYNGKSEYLQLNNHPIFLHASIYLNGLDEINQMYHK